MIEIPTQAASATSSALHRLPAAGASPQRDTDVHASPFLRLVQQAEQSHHAAYAGLQSRFAALDTREGASTADMLRLQAAMASFGLRVQITVRIADEIGRGIQTLTQRS